MEPLLLPSIIAIVVGGVAGVLSGLFGVGGGIIMVPALLYFLHFLGYPAEISMHFALATSLAIIAVTSIRSTHQHMKRQSVDFKLFLRWSPMILIGVGLGAYMAQGLNDKILSAIFIIFTLAVATNMILQKKENHPPRKMPSWMIYYFGLMIGILSALTGIGGAAISVPVMTRLGKTMHHAVGTASMISMSIGLAGAIFYGAMGFAKNGDYSYTIGYVNLIGFLIMAPASMLTVPLGARIAHAQDGNRLKKMFGVFLLIVAAVMITKMFF